MPAEPGIAPDLVEPIDEDDELEAAEQEAGLQAYERQYADERSWELLEEDESGCLLPFDPTVLQRAKRQRLLSAAQSSRIRRGMIRYLYVVLDLSRATLMTDFWPSRLAALNTLTQGFIREFFDQNPLSQLGLIVARNGIAERITELSGHPEAHITALKRNLDASGDLSLQNALEAARPPLANVPQYGTREVLVVMSALSTCDPGDVFAAVGACKKSRVRASVLGLGGEVHVCRRIAQDLGGDYHVALNREHLEELMMRLASPPASLAKETPSSLVNMGFPGRSTGAAMCACHGEMKPGPLYVCPRCKARVCDLPMGCPVCRLTLVSSPHLARSYHHLFPIAPFNEYTKDVAAGAACFACRASLGPDPAAGGAAAGMVLECPKCQSLFCADCDMFVHESLHNCPGCEIGAVANA
mmetsp:Transcript_28008/g.61303  ORF Transcript_28008/g.61303 Transcript_28008/m.61303 type:complete len:414 (-) Transcript_28008:554-1795(-)